jgi:hypothetical protein
MTGGTQAARARVGDGEHAKRGGGDRCFDWGRTGSMDKAEADIFLIHTVQSRRSRHAHSPL